MCVYIYIYILYVYIGEFNRAELFSSGNGEALEFLDPGMFIIYDITQYDNIH